MAGRYSFEVDKRSTWRQSVRYAQPAPTPRDARKPVDLTGWDAVLQARTNIGDTTALFTIDTRLNPQGSPAGGGTFAALDETGVITWTINMGALSNLPSRAHYELMLIDPDGIPKLVLRGQLELIVGVIDGP